MYVCTRLNVLAGNILNVLAGNIHFIIMNTKEMSVEIYLVQELNGYFCEPGRARFAAKIKEFPCEIVRTKYSITFSVCFGFRFR